MAQPFEALNMHLTGHIVDMLLLSPPNGRAKRYGDDNSRYTIQRLQKCHTPQTVTHSS